MMKTTLGYKDDFLYVVEEKDGATGLAKKWLPVRSVDYAEAQTLQGRPVTSVNQEEGVYVDEEGNVYQLSDKGDLILAKTRSRQAISCFKMLISLSVTST